MDGSSTQDAKQCVLTGMLQWDADEWESDEADRPSSAGGEIKEISLVLYVTGSTDRPDLVNQSITIAAKTGGESVFDQWRDRNQDSDSPIVTLTVNVVSAGDGSKKYSLVAMQ